MGNGPSLSATIQDGKDFFNDKLLFSVNFAAKSPYFTELKPNFHIMADPAFFAESKHYGIFETMASKIQWPLTLFLPTSAKKIKSWQKYKQKLESNPNIRIAYFNMTKINGSLCFIDVATMKGWGGPAPRNVMIPAIILSMRMQCPNIYLAGADHSWLKDISVNEKNEVLLNDKHFYDQLLDNQKSDFSFEDLAGIYEQNGESHLFAICTRFTEVNGIKILPQGKYLCADCTEENREQIIKNLIEIAKNKYKVLPDFTIQLIVLSGILQWNYQVQIFISIG